MRRASAVRHGCERAEIRACAHGSSGPRSRRAAPARAPPPRRVSTCLFACVRRSDGGEKGASACVRTHVRTPPIFSAAIAVQRLVVSHLVLVLLSSFSLCVRGLSLSLCAFLCFTFSLSLSFSPFSLRTQRVAHQEKKMWEEKKIARLFRNIPEHSRRPSALLSALSLSQLSLAACSALLFSQLSFALLTAQLCSSHSSAQSSSALLLAAAFLCSSLSEEQRERDRKTDTDRKTQTERHRQLDRDTDRVLSVRQRQTDTQTHRHRVLSVRQRQTDRDRQNTWTCPQRRGSAARR